jgi:hypothetical protein
MTQLEHVAEQDKPLDILKRLEQGRARRRPAQDVDAGLSPNGGAGSEMQI